MQKSKIPYVFIIFFAIIFAVDALYVYLANVSWRGVVIKKEDLKKINYQNFAKSQELQDELGWQVSISHNIDIDNILSISLSVMKNDKIVDIKSANVVLKNSQFLDKSYFVNLKKSGNVFVANTKLKKYGNWQAFFTIIDDQGNIFKDYRNFTSNKVN